MLPKNVYEFLQYGNHGQPWAHARADGVEYSATRETHTRLGLCGNPDTYTGRIKVRVYRGGDYGHDISPRDCPEGLDWKMSWTHEC